MKRTDFRPNNTSSSMTDKQRETIKNNKKSNWERIAGGYERNSKTGIIRATDKYGSFSKAHTEALKRQKEQDEKKHYDKLDKKREKTRSLLIDKNKHYGIGIRSNKLIYLKDGTIKMYSLVERNDGSYVTSDGKDLKKISNSNRNYMQNEIKFNKFFKEEREKYKNSANYSHDSNNYTGIGEQSHTSSYKEKPQSKTKLKNYGTNPYNLGFEKNTNIEQDNKGQWKYDADYYALNWKPSDKGNILYIEKSSYKKNGEHKSEILSKEVNSNNKSETKKLITQFKNIYKNTK